MSKKKFTFFSTMLIFILGLSGAEAQRTPRIPRIGILIPESGPSESQTLKGLRDGLKELRYEEGENLNLELRDAKGDRGALQPAAADLVSRKVDLIFTTGTRATQAAKAATREIPIVFRHPADPVELGFVKSMKRPGGNVTGVAAFSSQASQNRLKLLKEIVPNLRRIHIFYDSNNKFSQENFLDARAAAAKLRLEVADHPVKSADELKSSLDLMQAREGDAVFHVPDDLVESQAGVLLEAAKKQKLATMFHEEIWATRGSLAAYGPNYYQMGRQAAQLAHKILKGAKPKDLPVERASKFDLVINLRTANALGLNLSSSVLNKADKVIR